ncbi:MAG: hypothetical protein ACXABI_13620 [Candidatus Hodarchaeales archaeon]
MRVNIFSFKRRRRGQMFILATMLIAVYIVTMSGSILNIKTDEIVTDKQSIQTPYTNIKRELQSFMELLLAEFTDNSSSSNQTYIESQLESFLSTLESVETSLSFLPLIQMIPNSFVINAKTESDLNITTDTIYESSIQARFHLELSDLDSSISLYEDFTINFSCQVEVAINTLTIYQTKSAITETVDAAEIYVLNGSSPIYPTNFNDRTGYYIFESVSSIDNIGILAVILPNGVRIFS